MVEYFVAYTGTYKNPCENVERMAAGNDIIISPSPIKTIEQIRSAEEYIKDLHGLSGCAIMNFKEIKND